MTSPGRSLRTRALLGTLALVVAPALQACGDEPASVDVTGADRQSLSPGTPSATPDPSCEDVVPADAIGVLGWSRDGGAVSSALGCERRSAEGFLKVRDVGVVGDVGEEGVKAVEEAFDARCEELDSNVDAEESAEEPSPGVPVDWLGADVTACAVEPAEDIGLTKVLLLTPDDQLSELWVAALETTDQAKVREAVALMTEAALA